MKRVFLLAALIVSCVSGFSQHDSTGTVQNQKLEGITLFAPNIFTPNGNQYNDTWSVYIEGIDVYNFHLTIYNRAGQVMWESLDPNSSWDGTCGGNFVTEGMYPWIIETAAADTGKKEIFTGFVIIAR